MLGNGGSEASLVLLLTDLLAFLLMKINPAILSRNANSDKAGC